MKNFNIYNLFKDIDPIIPAPESSKVKLSDFCQNTKWWLVTNSSTGKNLKQKTQSQCVFGMVPQLQGS